MSARKYAVREAVAVFRSEKDLQAALDDLMSNGFDRSEISLLASTEAVEKELGHAYKSVRSLEDDPAAPAIAYVSTETRGGAEGAVIGGLIYLGVLAGIVPVVVSGGALAAVLAAGAIGGGGGAAIGSILGAIIEQNHADYVEEQLRKGGLLLWVRTWNEADEKRAVAILKEHSGADVHLHGVPDASGERIESLLQGAAVTATETYKHRRIIRYGHGVSYVEGAILASLDDARRHIDRRAKAALEH